ncbi:hypothetical protein CLOM_g15475, partial [Closterium sp. NIES-68]
MAFSALLLPVQRLIADIELIFDHRLASAAPLHPLPSLPSLSSLSALSSSSSSVVSPSRASPRDANDDKSSRSNRRAAIALVLVIAIAGVTVSLILACSTSSLSPGRLRLDQPEPPYGSTSADWSRDRSRADVATSSRAAFSGDEGDDGPGTPSAGHRRGRGWWVMTRSAQAQASAAAAAASSEVRFLLSLFRVTKLGQRLAEAATLECADAVSAPQLQASLASPAATAAAAAAAVASGSLGSTSASPGSTATFSAGGGSSARTGGDGGDLGERGDIPSAHLASGATSSSRSASASGAVACSARERAAGAPLAAVKAHRVSADDESLLALVRGKKAERERISLAVTDPALAFLFLAPPNAALPSPAVWNRFFEGHAGKYNVYVHAHPGVHAQTHFFNNSHVRAQQYRDGDMTAVDAVRRLLAPALANPRNFRFLILSPS